MLRYVVLGVFALSAWLATAQAQEPVAPLTLELTSFRELCTAGTPTEVSWQIAGGTPPYALSVEGEPVDADTESYRVNCGALTEAEAADENAPLAAKQITATVTDAKGARRAASIEVARARALPAPSQHGAAFRVPDGVKILTSDDAWQPDLDGEGRILVRHRPLGAGGEWTNVLAGWTTGIWLNLTADEHTTQMAYLRHPLEAETPEALNWNRPETHGKLKPPANLRATATHDTITVSFDDQPGWWEATVTLSLDSSSGELLGSVQRSFSSAFTPRPAGGAGRRIVFTHVPPNSNFSVWVTLQHVDSKSTRADTTGRTAPAPPGWTAPPQGPQNLRAAATHNSITVRWDPPYEDPHIYYFLLVSEAESGRDIYAIFPGANQREWTIRGGLYELLQPDTRYRVEVTHKGLPSTSAEIIVTTLCLPPLQGSDECSRANPDASVPVPPPLFEWWADGRPTTPLLYLKLTSSRNLCTAGTPTEISWQIAGGVPPYTLSIEGETVDAAADNVRVICGARAEPPASDTDAALEPKRVTATVTDSRGVQRKASLDVARARSLPPPLPSGITVVEHRTIGSAYWDAPAVAVPELEPAHYLGRWRAAGNETWTYDESARELPNSRWNWSIGELREGTRYELAIAAMRDQAEQLTPQALHWSSEIPFRTVGPPQNIVATSTHNSITVTWDAQPGNLVYAPYVTSANGAKDPSRESVSAGTHQAVFVGLQPDTEYDVVIPVLMTEGQEVGARTTIRTKAAPPDWQPLPTGPQNLRTTAAANSITAVWEAPHAQASPLYLVSLTDPETGLRVGHPRIIERTSFTFEGLLAETQYEVVITHLGIVEHGSSRVVTTASASSGGVRGRQSARSEIPFPFASLTR